MTSQHAIETKERPILFSGAMVSAILAGKKTQTRRAIKGQGEAQFLGAAGNDKADPRWWGWENADGGFCSLLPNPEVDAHIACPYGQPGDRLRVNETHRFPAMYDDQRPCEVPANAKVWYDADGPAPTGGARTWGRARVGRFMCSHFSRLTLEVVSVRAERLQAISEADALAEGVEPGEICDAPVGWAGPHAVAFCQLWGKINGPESWARNPWVWAVEFRRMP